MSPWPRNLNQMASGNPGAVQRHLEMALLDDREMSDYGLLIELSSAQLSNLEMVKKSSPHRQICTTYRKLASNPRTIEI